LFDEIIAGNYFNWRILRTGILSFFLLFENQFDKSVFYSIFKINIGSFGVMAIRHEKY